ncbi:protein ILITYHIA-like [Hibiscus syriacus]|uniref:protein ILITYHIA-like n=1 Tax=Hibiscus syriacus TaxID=106335 RepID=UPI00192458C6|nr:protein ILITYHIA-like [Hibiscus syriacus]
MNKYELNADNHEVYPARKSIRKSLFCHCCCCVGSFINGCQLSSKRDASVIYKLVRDAVSTARDKERRRKKGGPVVIPGFSLPKALQPLLPIFLQGLISGSAELRQQAALGLGELIEVTSEQSLKQFVIPITGPLIRIIGDCFPWQVKSAILSTLSIMIRKGGTALKPFLPQLQTTFIKCLQDNTRTVRSSAALALGKLSALSSRVDPLGSDLLSSLQASDSGVREAILTALKGVVKHAGKSVSPATRTRVYALLKDLIHQDDDQVRVFAFSILGVLSQYMEESELSDLLQELLQLSSSSSWADRHGAVLTFHDEKEVLVDRLAFDLPHS